MPEQPVAFFTDRTGRRRPITVRANRVGGSKEPPPSMRIVQEIALDNIWPDPEQHRRDFKEDELRSLGESIADVGLIEPIVVRPLAGPEGQEYQIIAGERRWRASQMAGLGTIEAWVRPGLTDLEARRLQIVENVQRAEINEVEEAEAYRQLYEGYLLEQGIEPGEATEEQDEEAVRWVADQVKGLTVRGLRYRLKTAYMPEQVKEIIIRGDIGSGHAAALARLLEGVEEGTAEWSQRQADVVNLARYCASDQMGKRKLDRLVSAYLERAQQGSLFGEDETSGAPQRTKTERATAARQREKFNEVFEQFHTLLESVWSEKDQEFDVGLMTNNELETIAARIRGMEQSLGGVSDAIARELETREALAQTTSREVQKMLKGPPGAIIQQFVPFTKIDTKRHIVTGVATSETWDTQNEQVAWEATLKAVGDYNQWRNIRAMHGHEAVGTAPLLKVDTVNRQVVLSAHIVDPNEWQKVETGVYKGFSIGGIRLSVEKAWNSVREKWGQRVKSYLWTETSLVDRPANPDAVFTMVKRAVQVRTGAVGGVALRRGVVGGGDAA